MRSHMLVAPLLLIVLAQTPADPPSVSLDFVLTSSRGEAPTDLTPADVTVKIGGKVRPLLSLESLDTRTAGRDIILIVEEATLYGLEKVAIDAINKAVEALQPRDRITYASTRGGMATVEPGTDVTKKKASAMVTGPGELYSCLSDLLTNIETFTKRLPRGRASFLAVIARGHPEGAAARPEDEGGCTPRRDALRQTSRLVSAAQINLHLFTVDHTTRSWGLDTVAANTGGHASLLTWANSDGIARALIATRRVYRATFAADPNAGAPQRVEVKVKRSDVKVRTSPTLAMHSAGPPAEK
jgi:hypothetical protein